MAGNLQNAELLTEYTLVLLIKVPASADTEGSQKIDSMPENIMC